MTDSGYEAAVQLYRESLAYRIGRSAADTVRIAARESAFNGWFRALATRWPGSLDRRIALIATTAAIASIAHFAIRSVLTRYSVSGLPWWWHGFAAASAIAIAAFAAPIARAWERSAAAAICRRLNGN